MFRSAMAPRFGPATEVTHQHLDVTLMELALVGT